MLVFTSKPSLKIGSAHLIVNLEDKQINNTLDISLSRTDQISNLDRNDPSETRTVNIDHYRVEVQVGVLLNELGMASRTSFGSHPHLLLCSQGSEL
jgi:hypothetical protein